MPALVAVEQVGAWWLGYPVLASVSLLLGSCTLWFPDWLVQPDWLKRRRFKKRLLRYRRKKRVIATKKRKEQLKKLKKSNKARQSSKKDTSPLDRDRAEKNHGRKRDSSQKGAQADRRKRSSRHAHERRQNERNLDSEAGSTTSVPDVVVTHNGSVPSENGDATSAVRRHSLESDASKDSKPSTHTTTTVTSGGKSEHDRKKERRRKKRRKQEKDVPVQRYRRINLRKEKLRGEISSTICCEQTSAVTQLRIQSEAEVDFNACMHRIFRNLHTFRF